jgi:hypothetical protein
MVKVFITYKLRPGVSREEYAAWSRRVDQPMATKQPGVFRYEIYQVVNGTDAEDWCDVMEVIEAESWDAWKKVNTYPDMLEAVEEWRQISIPESVRVVYGTQIEP